MTLIDPPAAVAGGAVGRCGGAGDGAAGGSFGGAAGDLRVRCQRAAIGDGRADGGRRTLDRAAASRDVLVC